MTDSGRDLARPPLPAGGDLRRRGHQLLRVLRGRRARRAVPVRRPAAPGASVRPRRGRRATAGTATCPASAPASATATGSTARGTRSDGQRCNPAKLLLDPYAKAIDGSVDWDAGVLRLPLRSTRTSATTDDSARVHAQGRRAQPVLRLGRRPPPAHAAARVDHLRGPRQGLHRPAPRRSRRRCAAPTPASPTRRPSST